MLATIRVVLYNRPIKTKYNNNNNNNLQAFQLIVFARYLPGVPKP